MDKRTVLTSEIRMAALRNQSRGPQLSFRIFVEFFEVSNKKKKKNRLKNDKRMGWLEDDTYWIPIAETFVADATRASNAVRSACNLSQQTHCLHNEQ